MIKDMEVECKTKFSMDVEFSFSFKLSQFAKKKSLQYFHSYANINR